MTIYEREGYKSFHENDGKVCPYGNDSKAALEWWAGWDRAFNEMADDPQEAQDEKVKVDVSLLGCGVFMFLAMLTVCGTLVTIVYLLWG